MQLIREHNEAMDVPLLHLSIEDNDLLARW